MKHKNRHRPVAAVPAVNTPSLPMTWMLGAALWILMVLFFYYQDNWPSFSSMSYRFSALDWPTAQAVLENAKPLGLCVWLSGLFFLMGRWLLKGLGLTPLMPLDRTVFAAGLGTGSLMLMVFFLGIGGAWYPSVLWMMCLGLSLLFAFLNRDLFRRSPAPSTNPIQRPPYTLIDRGLLMGIVFTLGCYLLGALAPEIAWDALACHLSIPAQWLLAHRVIPTPHTLYSGVPFNMEVLYGLAMALDNPVLAKLIHFAAGVGSLAALCAIGGHYSSRRAGLIGSLLFVTCPVVGLEFTQSAVELGSTFFGLLSVYALLLGQSESDPLLRKRWLILSGILCGFCLGTKYTTWILLPALILAHGIFWFSEHPDDLRGFFRESVLIAVPAALLVSPWIIKNIVFFKNPLYPFLQNVFKNAAITSDMKGFQVDARARNLFVQFSTIHGIWDYLTEPWTITMTKLVTVDFIGPAFLALVPFLVVPRAFKSKAMSTLLWVIAMEWFFYSFSSEVVRYRVPVLALLIALLTIRACDVRFPKLFQNSVLAALLLISVTNFTWANLFLFSVDGWKVTLGMMSAQDYLQHAYNTYPTTYYSAAEYINQHAPVSAKVLMLGEPRSLYVDRPVIDASIFDVHPIFTWANESVDGEALYARMRQDGVQYVLLNAIQARGLCGYWKGDFTESGRRVFDLFWQKHTHPVFQDTGGPTDGRDSIVFEIVPDRARLEPRVVHTPDIFLDILQQC